MRRLSLQALGLVAASAASVAAFDVIVKDVVVVGGGASGAYAAFRLREDYGKDVVLIEKEGALVRISILRTHLAPGLTLRTYRAGTSTRGPTPSPAERMTRAS